MYIHVYMYIRHALAKGMKQWTCVPCLYSAVHCMHVLAVLVFRYNGIQVKVCMSVNVRPLVNTHKTTHVLTCLHKWLTLIMILRC